MRMDMSKIRIAAFGTFTLLLATGVQAATPWKIRAVQLDVARQMETIPFLMKYAETVARAGYNTLVLYLEGRVQTSGFTHPDGYYTRDEMRQVVEHAAKYGVSVVPVVSVLGHAEHFFRDPKLTHLCEEREGRSRWGGSQKMTFCHSAPETRVFLERYLKEVSEVFPAPHFHVGLDEAASMAYCTRCGKKRAVDGFDGCFAEIVAWAHDVCMRLGKRMWMWDDMYEFCPDALERTPRDIVMCHWCYSSDISPLGSRSWFINRYRVDWIARFRDLGFDVLACPSTYSQGNVRTMTEWALRHDVMGGIMTQWASGRMFQGVCLPKILGTGVYWSDPAAQPTGNLWDAGVRMAYPTLSAVDRAAVVGLLDFPFDFASAGSDGALVGRPVYARTAARRGLVAALEARHPDIASGEVASSQLTEAGLLDDLLVKSRLQLMTDDIRLVVRKLKDPRRSADDVAGAKRCLRAMRPEFERLADRLERQQKAWRAGCRPQNAAKGTRAMLPFLDGLLALPDGVADDDEWMLEMNLVLPDSYGLPRFRVSGRFGTDWRELASGVWKPSESAGEGAVFTRWAFFRSEMPPEEVHIEQSGYGVGMMAYVSAVGPKSRIIPKEVVSVSGQVRDAVRLLEDTFDPTVFGTVERLPAFHRPELAERVSSVTLKMGVDDACGANGCSGADRAKRYRIPGRIGGMAPAAACDLMKRQLREGWTWGS